MSRFVLVAGLIFGIVTCPLACLDALAARVGLEPCCEYDETGSAPAHHDSNHRQCVCETIGSEQFRTTRSADLTALSNGQDTLSSLVLLSPPTASCVLIKPRSDAPHLPSGLALRLCISSLLL